jgi:hypothetical protein
VAEPIRSVEDEVPISYGRFDLFDGSDLGQEAEPEAETDALLAEPDQTALGSDRARSWVQWPRLGMGQGRERLCRCAVGRPAGHRP